MARTQRDDTLRLVVLLVAAFVLLPGIAMTLLMPTMGMMVWSDGHMVGAPTVWPAVMGVVWVTLLAVAGYALYRAFAGSRERRDPALEELREAYARGDLTPEEYEERRETLREE